MHHLRSVVKSSIRAFIDMKAQWQTTMWWVKTASKTSQKSLSSRRYHSKINIKIKLKKVLKNQLFCLRLSLSQGTSSIKTIAMSLLIQFSRPQAIDGNQLRPSTLSVMISSKKVPSRMKVRRKTNMVRSDPFAFGHHLGGNQILRFIRENFDNLYHEFRESNWVRSSWVAGSQRMDSLEQHL